MDSITGVGTIRLDLNSAGTGIATGAAGIFSGYTSGEVYTIDVTPPTVTSIVRKTPVVAFANATSLVYTINFNESVTGVDVSDFTITSSNVIGSSVASVSSTSGSAIDVTVTVGTITGTGTLRLDLNANSTGDNRYSYQ